nr:hypothetical protein [Citreicoccus inhibens]
MLDEDALGLAGAAGGVDDVGEVLWEREVRGIGGGECLQKRRGGVEEEGVSGGREEVGEAGVGEEEESAGVLKHEGEALRRCGGVEGDVGAAGLEDGEEGEEGEGGALEAESDADFRANAEGAQVVSELIGAGVELREGEGQGVVEDGEGERREG